MFSCFYSCCPRKLTDQAIVDILNKLLEEKCSPFEIEKYQAKDIQNQLCNIILTRMESQPENQLRIIGSSLNMQREQEQLVRLGLSSVGQPPVPIDEKDRVDLDTGRPIIEHQLKQVFGKRHDILKKFKARFDEILEAGVKEDPNCAARMEAEEDKIRKQDQAKGKEDDARSPLLPQQRRS